ncbi:hypothetical protein FBUS_03669 [Fasciolopsis buskii]|uniref:LEM domain-containing protein n=1 Tax=Fasciolopsis buskii TaxID=27845 RepID=A0A8E0RY88_9TREM|nr:hypothetical protein FBUS_03669 [Fasciolopsis buski]
MESHISDEELRSLLSEYMDVVPPVTDTTRGVLTAKLEKFLSAELQQPDLEPPSVDELPPAVLNISPLKPRETPQKPTETLSASEQIPDLSTDTNAGGEHGIPNASMYSIPFESPKDKSSPVYQYASQRPSYRRRSIHPDRPGLDSPYADFPLPDAHSRKSPGTFFKRAKPARVLGMGSESSASGCKLQDWLCMPVHFAISFVGALWFFVIRLIHHLRNSLMLSRISPRLVIYLLVLGLIITLGTKFLYGDPFYHNPVHDLHKWMQRRRI